MDDRAKAWKALCIMLGTVFPATWLWMLKRPIAAVLNGMLLVFALIAQDLVVYWILAYTHFVVFMLFATWVREAGRKAEHEAVLRKAGILPERPQPTTQKKRQTQPKLNIPKVKDPYSMPNYEFKDMSRRNRAITRYNKRRNGW